MKNKYRKEMAQLPVSDDLEKRTIERLKAASVEHAEEEGKMNNSTKKWAVGTGIMAVAACLILVTMSVFGGFVQKETISEMPNGTLQAETIQVDALESEEMAMFDGAAIPGGVGKNVALPNNARTPWNTEEYSAFAENRFLSTLTTPLSTFAADVDTASYAKMRASILSNEMPVPDSVRIEEMLNYFHYDYALPTDTEPFGVTVEIAPCPWNKDTQLLLIGLQAQTIQAQERPRQNLVFLVDVSGSMEEADKLPLVKRAFLLLLEELDEEDVVSIVTYASAEQVILDGVPAKNKTAIMAALEEMTAWGGTDGAKGIETAYQLAQKNYITGGNNRVVLATDGDLNIGISDEGSLTRFISEKKKSGVYLSVLGFGNGNYKDNKLEALADNGNGNYAYIDTIFEARKALVEEIGATFLTIAKDVKLQLDFNPTKIKGYRLIGYENRTMAAEDFINDQKDGGEIGSGHQMTVLYEIVPIDSPMSIDTIESKYQTSMQAHSDELMTLSIRAKQPNAEVSQEYTYAIGEEAIKTSMSDNLQFASAVAEAGMLLRESEFKGTASYDNVIERLRKTKTVVGDAYKEEFLYMISLLQRHETK